MRFTLIDRIDELIPGKLIVAVKNVSLAEEYLADHFPGFPVLPGVLMLEAMTQASAWLVRASEDFAHSIVVLKEARNIKYGRFVEPGDTLTITSELSEQTPEVSVFKTKGTVNGESAVSAKLWLSRYNLAAKDPDRIDADTIVRQNLRELFATLRKKGAPRE